MSKIIIVKGCISCPYSCHTDDFDNYSGFKCEINSNVGWGEEEFANMYDDSVDAKCPLPDYEEGGEEWKERQMIEKAVSFLNENLMRTLLFDKHDKENFINNFKKAMK